MGLLFQLVALSLSSTCALRVDLQAGRMPASATLRRTQPQLRMQAPESARSPASTLLAASLAAALVGSNPTFTFAVPEPPAVIQQYGSALVADEELRPEQLKFLEERKKMKTQYESYVESNFATAEETAARKDKYYYIVGGLLVIAFVVPMLQFFYYTGGE